MSRKRKVGRPKMPENLKKIGFSIKVSPELWRAIEVKTKGKNRNQDIESILEEKYLQTIAA